MGLKNNLIIIRIPCPVNELRCVVTKHPYFYSKRLALCHAIPIFNKGFLQL